MDTDHHERQHGGTEGLTGLHLSTYLCSVLWLKTQLKKKKECTLRKTVGQSSPSAHATLFQVQQGKPHSSRLQIQCRKIGNDPVRALLDSHQPAQATDHAPGAKVAAEPCHSRCRPAPRVKPAVQSLAGPAHVSFWCFGACFDSREKSINASGL